MFRGDFGVLVDGERGVAGDLAPNLSTFDGVTNAELLLFLILARLDGVLGVFFLSLDLLPVARDVGLDLLQSAPGVKKESRLDWDIERFLELVVGLTTIGTVHGPSLNFSTNSSCTNTVRT